MSGIGYGLEGFAGGLDRGLNYGLRLKQLKADERRRDEEQGIRTRREERAEEEFEWKKEQFENEREKQKAQESVNQTLNAYKLFKLGRKGEALKYMNRGRAPGQELTGISEDAGRGVFVLEGPGGKDEVKIMDLYMFDPGMRSLISSGHWKGPGMGGRTKPKQTEVISALRKFNEYYDLMPIMKDGEEEGGQPKEVRTAVSKAMVEGDDFATIAESFGIPRRENAELGAMEKRLKQLSDAASEEVPLLFHKEKVLKRRGEAEKQRKELLKEYELKTKQEKARGDTSQMSLYTMFEDLQRPGAQGGIPGDNMPTYDAEGRLPGEKGMAIPAEGPSGDEGMMIRPGQEGRQGIGVGGAMRGRQSIAPEEFTFEMLDTDEPKGQLDENDRLVRKALLVEKDPSRWSPEDIEASKAILKVYRANLNTQAQRMNFGGGIRRAV